MATKTKSRRTGRELIAPKRSKRYVRRNRQGEFKKEVTVGRSLAADRRRQAKTKVPKGQGDRGDTQVVSIITRLSTPRLTHHGILYPCSADDRLCEGRNTVRRRAHRFPIVSLS